MSDELTPEQDEAVRRLLAEARHSEPVPADVAARLDAALADLGPEDAEHAEDTDTGAEPAPVVDLDTARRRRRNAGRVLVAAAAVIVAGVGIGQVIGVSDGSDDSSAGGSTAVQQEAPDRGQSESADAAPPPAALAEQVPLQLNGTDLAQQVEDQLGALPSDVRSETLAGDSPLLTDPSFTCQSSVSTADGTRVIPAYVDGAAALLALSPADGGPQSARLVDCATGDDLASFDVTLP